MSDSKNSSLMGLTTDKLERLRGLSKVASQRSDEQRLVNQRKKEEKLKNLSGRDKSDTPTLKKIEAAWRDGFASRFPGILQSSSWTGKERGQVRKLLAVYDADAVIKAVVYVLNSWEKLKGRFPKIKSSFPTVGVLLGYHDTLVPEADRVSGIQKAIETYERLKEEVGYGAIPQDVQDSYAKAVKEKQEFGLL